MANKTHGVLANILGQLGNRIRKGPLDVGKPSTLSGQTREINSSFATS